MEHLIVWRLIALGVRYSRILWLGGILGFGCCALLSRRFRLPVWKMLLVALLALGGGAVVLKVFGAIDKALCWRRIGREFTLSELIEFAIDSNGVIYGGICGFYLTAAILIPRLLKKPRLAWDIIAPSAALAHGVGRIGCYFALKKVDGSMTWYPCCYGIRGKWAFWDNFWDDRIPVQLIESAFELLLVAFMLALLFRGGEKWRGKLPMVYLIAYPAFRYIIEFFRGDGDIHGSVGIFSFAQLVSLLLLVGVWGYSVLVQKGKLKPLPPAPEENLIQGDETV